MRELMDQMAELHRAWGQPVAESPAHIAMGRQSLRMDLLREEAEEAIDAMMCRDPLDTVAKELVDVIVVTVGAALEYGIPLDRCWDAVLESNRSKLGDDGKPVLNEHGKVTKGPNYQPPDMRRAVFGDDE